jgi:hypothetical protein
VGIKEVDDGIWLVVLWTTISVISIWRRRLCSPYTILLAQRCKLSVRNVL